MPIMWTPILYAAYFLPLPPRRGGYANALNARCPPLAGELKGVVEMCPRDKMLCGTGLPARPSPFVQTKGPKIAACAQLFQSECVGPITTTRTGQGRNRGERGNSS